MKSADLRKWIAVLKQTQNCTEVAWVNVIAFQVKRHEVLDMNFRKRTWIFQNTYDFFSL